MKREINMKKVFMKAGNRTLSKRLFSIMLIIGILFSMMPDATYADNSGRPPDVIEQEDTEDTESEMSDNKAAEPEQNTESDETAQDESSCQDTQAWDVQTEEDEGNHDNEVMTTMNRSYVRSYRLDVITSGSGTFDVCINGRLKASGCNNFHQNIQCDEYGETRYEIGNIRAATGYYYQGPPRYQGRMDSNVNIRLDFQAKRMTVTFYRNINSSDKINAKQTFISGAGQSFSDKKWTKTGYTLLGWAETRNATAQQYSTLSPVTDGWIDARTPNIESNVALYAVWGRNNYSISYTLNGGSISGQKTSYNVENDSFTLPTPTRTGDTFTGWTGTGLSGLTKTVTVSKGSTGNRSCTANWSTNGYTVSFNYNKPSTATGTMSGNGTTSKGVTSAAAYGTLPQPSMPGWTFDGWYTAASGGSKISATTTYTATGNQTLYAHWTLNTYSISYNANGGSLSGQRTNYNVETDSFTLPTPTRNGYTFTGWTGTGLSSATKSVTVSKGSTGNRSYTANWSTNGYTVSFNYNKPSAATGTMTGNGTASKGVTYAANYGDLPAPSMPGWTFDGWYTAASGGSKISATTTYTATGNQTLYAHWTLNTYSISYNANGGSLSGQKTSYNIETATFTLPTPTRTGYTFTGWTGSNGTTAQKTVTIAKGSTGNKSYTANWTPTTWTVKYDANGGTGTMSTDTATYNENYVAKANQFTRIGYEFAGWTENADGSGSNWTSWIGKPWKWTYTKNITLYAQWKANTYTNSILHWAEGFKYSEGNNNNKNALRLKDTCFSASYKSDIVMDSAKAVKIPNGYYLRGLGTSEADGTFKGYSMGLKLTQKPASMWFEYYYDPVSYSITYNLNGGTNNNSNPSTYDVLYGVSLKALTRTGYTFTGWYDENGNKITGINEGCNATFSSADDLYAKLATRTTGNRILTAHWSYNPVSVKVPQVLTGDHTGRSQFRVKCDDFKAGNIKVTVPNNFSYKQTGKADVTAVITSKSGNNIITPSNKVCVYNITTTNGLSAGCWSGSFNIGLTLTKE